ncbi:tyrosine-type recombinase/integrase|uniref:Phage integrase family protein n=1 Tax=Dendrosporobacter quercicolus TaxID=146817 RepID=A0A1G9LSC3_9FIRM|nr:tyrosine-type recombinase/integrase [Dendrosporobacter quercicolus]NSL46813.1 tyrosine-type recombinase/integrase [Dendrosporobacter quercicolus DSM 1736]SDL64849.1 Phage integrase family protein [Dendrosporobacter quercicolus]
MKFVEPFRSKKDVETVRLYLRGKALKHGLWFWIGVNSALRISDLLSLTVGNVQKSNGAIVDKILVKEQKTGKTKEFPISDKIRTEIRTVLQHYTLTEAGQPLFPSHKTGEKGQLKPIGRSYANQLITEAAQMCNITGNYGSHSMRKSFAYFAWQQGTDVLLLMDLLNHSSPKDLRRYIGITQEQLNKVYLAVDLG